MRVTSRVETSAGTGIPGSGTGLIGLRERVSLLGGVFTAGRVGADFVVSAQLPQEA
ncbi:MAG: hypothetical protein HOV79_30100 [Hamadaea sp.]|nr:hypothetical protein [Hamadaea sp.]